MPESRDCGGTNLSQLSTEELERILRQDAEAPEEQETDTDFLLEVMEVLAERNRENAHTPKTAEEAWESFQKNYAPKAGGNKSAKPVRPWLRHLIAASAALVLILCIPTTAKALSLQKLWDVVARWAKETFSFVSGDAEQVSEPEATDAIEYSSLQDLLKRNNRPYDMVPTWIPDGFVLEKVEKNVMPGAESYRAFYRSGTKEMKIRVKTYSPVDSWSVEIENIVETYERYGIEYHIFSNLEQLQIVWISQSYECLVSGDISLEEAKKMIESIERGQ